MSVTIITHGCRLNGSESRDIQNFLPETLHDLAVVNTCAVTEEAMRQSAQSVRALAREGKKVLVTGCAATMQPEFFASLTGVEAVIPNGHKTDPQRWHAALAHLPHLPVGHLPVGGHQQAPQGQGEVVHRQVPDRQVRPAVAIQTGCDHACTFCAIPQGRGRNLSRSFEEICAAIEALPTPQEIVLTGVDISAYGLDLPRRAGHPYDLAGLLESLVIRFPHVPRWRLSSLDAGVLDARFVDAFCSIPSVAPHLHLSLQAGDDLILKRMRRRHSTATMRQFVEAIRHRRPDTAIGADIIAGFPTETAAQFANTQQHLADLDVIWGHVFPYSARANTPAARMPQLALETKRQRAKILRMDCAQRATRFVGEMADTTTTVVIEQARSKHHPHASFSGKTPHFITAHVHTALQAQRGDLISVRLTSPTPDQQPPSVFANSIP